MDIDVRREDIIDAWVVRPKPQPRSRLRLFCFPYVGGGAVVYHKWPEWLPAEIEMCAIRLPGRESRITEPPFTRVRPAVQELAQVLRPLLDKPYAFFGHSMGAVIAFELARRLRRERHETPVRLLVSGCYPPHLLTPGLKKTTALTDDEFIQTLREYNGLPEEILQESELMQLFLPMLRADFEMFETYACTEEYPLECPISSFGGLSDPKVGREHVLGWHRHTKAAFHSHMLPGDHFFLQTAREQLIERISQDLMIDLQALRSTYDY